MNCRPDGSASQRLASALSTIPRYPRSVGGVAPEKCGRRRREAPGVCSALASEDGLTAGGRDVHSLRSLAALLRLVLDAGALRQGPEPVHLDVGVVDEEVLPPLVRRDEAVALRVVEPLHSSGRHYTSLRNYFHEPCREAQSTHTPPGSFTDRTWGRPTEIHHSSRDRPRKERRGGNSTGGCRYPVRARRSRTGGSHRPGEPTRNG